MEISGDIIHQIGRVERWEMMRKRASWWRSRGSVPLGVHATHQPAHRRAAIPPSHVPWIGLERVPSSNKALRVLFFFLRFSNSCNFKTILWKIIKTINQKGEHKPQKYRYLKKTERISDKKKKKRKTTRFNSHFLGGVWTVLCFVFFFITGFWVF